MSGLSLKVGYVMVEADEDYRSDGTLTDDFTDDFRVIYYLNF